MTALGIHATALRTFRRGLPSGTVGSVQPATYGARHDRPFPPNPALQR